MDIPKLALVAAIAATLATSAHAATATPETQPRNLAAQYSQWAGSRANADSLVNGLRNGSSIMLVTQGPANGRSMAGFTPRRALSESEVASALAHAQRSLSRLGIQRPTAEQIQAALIGGEIEANGRLVQVRGELDIGPLAAR